MNAPALLLDENFWLSADEVEQVLNRIVEKYPDLTARHFILTGVEDHVPTEDDMEDLKRLQASFGRSSTNPNKYKCFQGNSASGTGPYFPDTTLVADEVSTTALAKRADGLWYKVVASYEKVTYPLSVARDNYLEIVRRKPIMGTENLFGIRAIDFEVNFSARIGLRFNGCLVRAEIRRLFPEAFYSGRRAA